MNRDGYILVAVLSTMLVLAGLVASATLVTQSALRSARAEDGTARLEGLARGGLELAAYQVFALKQPFSAVNGRPLRLPGGVAVARFTDGAAKIDINASDPTVLLGALTAAGVDSGDAATLVGRLTAMRGSAIPAAAPMPPDAIDPTRAPAAPAATQGPHTDFASLADFAAFAQLGPAEAAGLADVLTVDNPDGRVDAMTADRAVLLALPAMSEALADSVLAERRQGANDRLKAALDRQADFVKFEPGPCYGVELTATDAAGRSAHRRGVVAASRSPDEPFLILAWEPAP